MKSASHDDDGDDGDFPAEHAKQTPGHAQIKEHALWLTGHTGQQQQQQQEQEQWQQFEQQVPFWCVSNELCCCPLLMPAISVIQRGSGTPPIKYFHAYVALIKTTRSQAERLLCSGILRRVGAQIIPFHFSVELYFAFQTLFKSP